MPPADEAKILADQLAKGLEEVKKIVENLRTDLHASAVANAELKKDVQHCNHNVEKLNRIVLDVHASDSFAASLITVEKTLGSLQKSFDDQNKTRKDLDVEDKKGRWQVRASMIAGSVSLLVCIITVIVSFLHR